MIEMIKKRGHTLPEILQRQVHWSAPGNKLLDPEKIPRYYNPPPDKPWPPRVADALKLYDESIRKAVKERHEATEELRALWNRARELDVSVLDDDKSEPATGGELPPPPPSPEELERLERNRRCDRAQAVMGKLGDRYAAVTQKLAASGVDFRFHPEFVLADHEMALMRARIEQASRRGFGGVDTFEDESGVKPPPLEEQEPPAPQEGDDAMTRVTKEYEIAVFRNRQEMSHLIAKGGDFVSNPEFTRLTAEAQKALQKFVEETQRIHAQSEQANKKSLWQKLSFWK